jgi:hypothetical protein
MQLSATMCEQTMIEETKFDDILPTKQAQLQRPSGHAEISTVDKFDATVRRLYDLYAK